MGLRGLLGRGLGLLARRPPELASDHLVQPADGLVMQAGRVLGVPGRVVGRLAGRVELPLELGEALLPGVERHHSAAAWQWMQGCAGITAWKTRGSFRRAWPNSSSRSDAARYAAATSSRESSSVSRLILTS